jgi:outer membrane autotransporter protein
MLEFARLKKAFAGNAARGRRTGTAIGIAFAATLLATGAQAQNCTLVNPTTLNFAGAGFSPASVSSMISGTIVSASTAFLLQSTAFIGSPPNPQPDQQGGGIWVRGVGGEVSVKSSTNSSLTSTGAVPATGSALCFQKVDEDFAGIQFGRDLGILNVNGWNLHWGVTAGYIGTSGTLVGGAASFPDAFTGATVGGGPFTSTTNVPFIGAYAAATYGGFSVDALLRTEYYQTSLNAPAASLLNQNIDAHGITFAASAAYQWQVPNSNWFIEPSAGVIISRIKVDPFNFLTSGSSGIFGGSIVDDRLSGTLQLNDIKSDIGRLGLRFGTTVDAGSVVWQPFAAVSVWHEFGPNITSNYATCPSCVVVGIAGVPVFDRISATSSTTTIGTFGQYSLGVSVTAPGTGWLGFARVDFRDGPDLQGWSGTGGIRYQFAPEPGHAPITKTKAPPAPVVEAVNWTGFYIGGFGGATQGTADWGWGFGASVAPHIGGFLFGADAGYNYQFGNYVVGLEGDLAGTDTKGGTACGALEVTPVGSGFVSAIGPMFQMTCNAKIDWVATAAARAGFTWDRALFFVKGGGAWTHEQFSATCNTASVTPPINPSFVGNCTNPAGAGVQNQNGVNVFGPTSTGFSAGTTRTGWVLGFGTEFAFSRNWSARAETDYISFGDTNVTASDGSALRVGMHFWEEKIGLNYRF